MKIEELKAYCEAIPFYPFVVNLVDGRSFIIPHSDYISFIPKDVIGNRIMIWKTANGIISAFCFVDTTQITSLDTLRDLSVIPQTKLQ